MIHTEAWYKDATLHQDLLRAVQEGDWERVRRLLPRFGVTTYRIAAQNVQEYDVPSYFQRPLSHELPDIRWDCIYRLSSSSEDLEHWPPQGTQSPYMRVEGDTVIDLDVSVGEDLVEMGWHRLDGAEAAGVALGVNIDTDMIPHIHAPRSQAEWEAVFEKSIKGGWGKQVHPQASASTLTKVKLLDTPTPASNPSDGFEVQYDEWYPVKWEAKVKTYWTAQLSIEDLLKAVED